MEKTKICEFREQITQNGFVILRVNIALPVFKKERKTQNSFYKRISKAFLKYSKTKLAKKARSVCENAGFEAYAAVMRCYVCFENESLLCIGICTSVFDGNTRAPKREFQLWDKSKGVLLSLWDVFRADRKKQLKALVGKKLYNKRFYIDERGFCFFEGLSEEHISFEKLFDTGVLKEDMNF